MRYFTNRKVILTKRPSGAQKDFRELFSVVEEKISDELENGEILLRICYLSVGPGCRNYINERIPIGGTMRHWTGGQVIASKDPRFQVGELVCGGVWDWQDYWKVKVPLSDPYAPVTKIPKGISFPTWLALGANQGPTSYFGIVECAELKAGDNVLVSAAAGATGSLVGQIAKIFNCKVVGFCGTDDKCNYIVNSLGFDGAINYKTTKDYKEAVKSHFPDGIDVYFDNIGGPFLEAALANIKKNGRVSICGQLASYNSDQPQPGPTNIGKLIWSCAKIQGFNVFAYPDKWNKAISDLTGWIHEGKLQAPKMTVIEGLENSPEALTRLFNGQKIGKVLVHIADPNEKLMSKL